MKNIDWRLFLAECLGTFALVFCGTGAIVVNDLSGGALGLVGISFAFGIIVIAMIYILGNISGCHINPAVTIALWVGKSISKSAAIIYILAQIIGAFLASFLLTFLFPDNLTLGATLPSGGILPSFLMEFVLTLFLMLTIYGVSSRKDFSSISGLIIGLIVTGIILIAGPISGGSFNPARSIAPAIVSGNVTALWVYIIAPVLGAVTATFIWNVLKDKKSIETD